jgi:hypothetical protein
MNANNNINFDLVKYATLIGVLIVFNYFLWSINSWQILRFINFFLLIGVLVYFFVSKKFNHLWYLKLLIFLLLIICLGTPTIPIDSRTFFLLPGKILFYESNLYMRLSINTSTINFVGHDFLDTVFSRPKLASSLSATFAQILGFWNDIFPKTINVIIILPAIFVLISFFKDRVLIQLWIFLMLFFSGKLFVNGLMDGILSLYFVSSILITYKISITKNLHEKKILYFLMFIFFIILSLCKHEGGVMIPLILLSKFLLDFMYKSKFDYKYLLITIFSLLPIIFWRYIFLKSDSKMEFLHYGNPISRFIERLSNSDDLQTLFNFLLYNDKLILSLAIFIICAFKFYSYNKKLILFVSINFLLYFTALISAVLISTHSVLEQLEQSSARIFIPLVLLLVYFSIFLTKNNYSIDKR